MDFIRFATSTQSLASQANYIPYGPVRRSSMMLLSPEQRSRLPNSEQHLQSGLKLNAQWWSKNLSRINPIFQRWLERPVMVPKKLPR